MKKLLTVLLTVLMVCGLAACSSSKTETESGPVETDTTTEDENTANEAPTASMSYVDFMAAEDDSEVDVLMYVQDKQGWWENEGQGQLTIYGADEEGGYFVYNANVDEETAATITEGTLIKVTGVKSTWAGEPEIIDATVEVFSDQATYVAPAIDATDSFTEDGLYNFVNQKVSLTGLTVVDKGDGAAFLYNWDGSGSQGDDLYFDLTDGTNTYTFTVESYLRGADTDVYKTVESLQVGALVDVECFMYWYEGPNAHVISVTSAH